MEWHQAGYDRACWPCGCSGKPPSHRPTSSPLPSTTPALMLLGQWTGWQPHGCTGLDGINWLLCPPSGITVWADWPRDLRMQDKFHQKGLSSLRFSLKQTEEKQQLPQENNLKTGTIYSPASGHEPGNERGLTLTFSGDPHVNWLQTN